MATKTAGKNNTGLPPVTTTWLASPMISIGRSLNGVPAAMKYAENGTTRRFAISLRASRSMGKAIMMNCSLTSGAANKNVIKGSRNACSKLGPLCLETQIRTVMRTPAKMIE